jgi:DNA mismatch repair protein MutL
LALSSKPEGQSEAWQAHCEGREMEIELNPTAHPKGTSVEVLDLFFNTPARRKFLKAEKTEFQHVEEIVKRIALSHFHVGFTLKHNGRVIHRLPAVSEQFKSKRIAAICGQGFVKESIDVLGEYEGVKIMGWCNAVGQGRRTNDLQYSFVNGRMMKDRVIIHAIRQAFEGMIDSQTYPAFVLYIEMPANELDVNVHPAKHEVRFHKSRQVHDVIYKSVSDALLLSAQTDEIKFGEEPSSVGKEPSSVGKEPYASEGETASSESSNTKPLFDKPSHGYSTETPSNQNIEQLDTGYIAPLANKDAPLAGKKAPLASKDAPLASKEPPLASYTPAQHGLQGRKSSGGYRGNSPVSATATASYQNLMSASDQSKDAQTAASRSSVIGPWFMVDDNKIVFSKGLSLHLIPSFYIPAALLVSQIVESDVVQPLLMPVSVKQDKEVNNLALLKELGFDLKHQMQKWILKQVPAALRQLPWVSIFPRVLAYEGKFKDNEELLQYICYCWSQSYHFSEVEMSNYIAALRSSRLEQVVSEYAVEIALPKLSTTPAHFAERDGSHEH